MALRDLFRLGERRHLRQLLVRSIGEERDLLQLGCVHASSFPTLVQSGTYPNRRRIESRDL